MKRLEKIEKVLSVVSNGGIVAFGVSIPMLIVADVIWGEPAFNFVIVWLTYPGLIVGLGTVAASDLAQAVVCILLSCGLRSNWLGVLFAVSRGISFGTIAAVIALFEFKLLGFGA